jgi:hypothetical protein
MEKRLLVATNTFTNQLPLKTATETRKGRYTVGALGGMIRIDVFRGINMPVSCVFIA